MESKAAAEENLMMEIPKNVATGQGEIQIDRFLGRGKSGYSYLGKLDGRPVVYKQMHNEPVEVYSFSANKVDLELNAYQQLREIGIPVPELILAAPEDQYLVKEFVVGLCGHEWVASGGADPEIIRQLFSLASLAGKRQINLDYFPPNFVISGGRLVYIDYEVNAYSDAWSLENWGIYYWANQAGMADYLKTGGWEKINQDASSGIPIKQPFSRIVADWIDQYSSRENHG